MKKRLMAWLLVCFMMVGTMAVPVMAEEDGNAPVTHEEGGNEGGGDEGGGNEGGGNEGGGNEGGGNEGGGNEGGGNEGGGNEGGGDEGGGDEGGGNEGGGNEGGGNEGGGNEGGGNEGGGNEGGGNEGGGNEGGGNEGGGNEGGGNEGGGNEGGGSGEGGESGEGGTQTGNCPSGGDHNWGTETVKTNPTCSAVGKKIFVCSKCLGIKEEDIPKLEHKPNSTWVAKAAGHHHYCTVCGEAMELQDHYPGPAATEEKDQICLTCGYIMTRKKGHVHKYDTKYSSDQTGHWYACSGCAEKGSFKEHTFKDVCTAVCSDCGFEIEPQHDYSGVWLSDEKGHWMICDGCGHTRETEAHEPGEAATASHAQLCTVCGYELAPKLAPETIAPDDERVWQVNDTSHWKLDEDGSKVGEGLHLWDEGMDRWDGKVVYTCKTCGAERTEGLTVTETEETGGGINFPLILLVVMIVLFLAAAAVLIVVLVMNKKKSRQYKGRFDR